MLEADSTAAAGKRFHSLISLVLNLPLFFFLVLTASCPTVNVPVLSQHPRCVEMVSSARTP